MEKKIISRLLGKARAMWDNHRSNHRVRQIEKIDRESGRRSREELQIMEYRGKMYISYRGVPIVSDEDLGAPWADVLMRSRDAYQAWLSEKELEK